MSREPRKGWEWVSAGATGFWSKVKGPEHKHKKAFFCPHEDCGRPLGTVDDAFVEEYGVCYLCYTMCIESRDAPVIDLAKYRKDK